MRNLFALLLLCVLTLTLNAFQGSSTVQHQSQSVMLGQGDAGVPVMVATIVPECVVEYVTSHSLQPYDYEIQVIGVFASSANINFCVCYNHAKLYSIGSNVLNDNENYKEYSQLLHVNPGWQSIA